MRLPVALLAVLLALSGCSDGDGGADDDTSPGDDVPDDGAGGDGSDVDDGGTGGDDGGDGGGGDAGNETAPRDPVTWEVSIVDNEFVDGSLTIQVGDTVVWTHDGAMLHTVTSQDDEVTFDSGNMVAGSEFQYTFDEVGEFPYNCNYHNMPGTITVLERSDATP